MKIAGTGPNGITLAPLNASKTGKTAHQADLWKACQNFEALFMGYLVSSMEKTLPQGVLSGAGLPNFMFNQVMGTAMSDGGGIGLADLLYRNLQSQDPENAAGKDGGISLQEMFTPRVRKDDNVETTSR